MTRITKKNFKKALVNTGGNQTRIAEKLGVTRQAVSGFLKRHPDMKVLQEEQIDLLYDIAEDNVAIDIIVRKDTAESKWLLLNSKRGRERGYGTKVETEHSGTLQNVIFQEIVKSDEEIKEMKHAQTDDIKQ